MRWLCQEAAVSIFRLDATGGDGASFKQVLHACGRQALRDRRKEAGAAGRASGRPSPATRPAALASSLPQRTARRRRRLSLTVRSSPFEEWATGATDSDPWPFDTATATYRRASLSIKKISVSVISFENEATTSVHGGTVLWRCGEIAHCVCGRFCYLCSGHLYNVIFFPSSYECTFHLYP